MEPINRYLDAAVLAPEETREGARGAIQTCIEYRTRTVCVRPCDVPLAIDLCKGTETEVSVVLGFPHGVQLADSKVDEAKRYVAAGVSEIDMVVNYGFARSGMWPEVEDEVAAVVAVCKPAGVALKVIFETAQLDLETVEKLVHVCVAAGADFVKTSTGFGGGGATDEAVQCMLDAAAGRIKVKPSGGIRDRERAEHLVQMGAHRLGVNWKSCAAICDGAPGGSSESY